MQSPMTRLLLLAILIAQILGTYVVTRTIVELSSRVDELSAQTKELDKVTRDSNRPLHQAAATRARSLLSEQRLRVVIADEVRKALLSAPRGPEISAPEPPPDPAGARTNEIPEEVIEQEIEDHISTGVISPGDMNVLQARIARLDKEARRRMLRKLIGAMNDGSLKGRL